MILYISIVCIHCTLRPKHGFRHRDRSESFWGNEQTFPCKFIWCNLSCQRQLPRSAAGDLCPRLLVVKTKHTNPLQSAWVTSPVAKAKPNACAPQQLEGLGCGSSGCPSGEGLQPDPAGMDRDGVAGSPCAAPPLPGAFCLHSQCHAWLKVTNSAPALYPCESYFLFPVS